MDQLPRLGKRELICLLLLTCNCVVSVWFALPLCVWDGLRYFLWHSLSLPYSYLTQHNDAVLTNPQTMELIAKHNVYPCKQTFYNTSISFHKKLGLRSAYKNML